MASHPLMGRIIQKFDRQEDCDVTFNVQGRRLGAHKMILSLQDFPLFDKSKDQGNIQVDDVDYGTFRSIIRFLYTEEISIDGANIFHLMHASNSLQITAVGDRCSSYFAEFVTTQNFGHLLNISTDFKITALQNQLLEFFKGPNMTTIIHDVNFKRLTPEGIALLLTVPPSGDNGATELDFFIALRRWARFECQRQGIRLASGHQIRQVFGENFKYLGVPYMRLEDVSRLVIGKGILEKDEELSLLHFMSMPAELRKNIDIQFPFDYTKYLTGASLEAFHTEFTYCSSCGTELIDENEGYCDECGCANELPISLSRSEGPVKALEDDRTRSFEIERKKCALCSNKLDRKYGAEMIHCTECKNDFCFKCQSDPSHQSHRKFFSIKTVLGDHTTCCKTCGWPKEFDAQSEMTKISGFRAHRNRISKIFFKNPQYNNPQSNNPQYNNPQHSNPQFSHPQFSHPQFSHPQHSNPQFSHPQHSNPQFSQWHPQFSHPQFSHPQHSNPQFSHPQFSHPQFSHPQFSNPQYHEPTTSYTCHNCDQTMDSVHCTAAPSSVVEDSVFAKVARPASLTGKTSSGHVKIPFGRAKGRSHPTWTTPAI